VDVVAEKDDEQELELDVPETLPTEDLQD
jgi:hypothetical protein